MFSARLLALLLIGAACAKRPESSKPPRAAAVSDASATRVHNTFDPAPYSTALFQPENLDLTGFFGPQFVSPKQTPGVDLNALYAQYGSPHQHFAFTFPTKEESQPSRQQNRPRVKVPQAEAPIPMNVPNKQASEEIYYGQQYAQPPAYAQAVQPQYAAIAQHHQQALAYPQQHAPAVYETEQPTRQPIAAYPAAIAMQPQAHPAHLNLPPQYQYAYQTPVEQAQQPPAYANHFQSYQPQAAAQQPQALQPQGLPTRPKKVDIQAVLQSQVLPQLKGAQGIQLLDLSEFFPPKEGQQPTYFHITPSEDYKTASLTPVQLSSFYQQAGQQSPGSKPAQSAAYIPDAAIRQPTLSPAEVAAYLKQQAAYGQPYAPQSTSNQFSKPSSYAYSQISNTPARQQQLQQQQHQIDLNSYYAQQPSNRPEDTAQAVYPGQTVQFTEHDASRQPQVYYAAQPNVEPEEVAPSKAPSNEAHQYSKSTVAKAVKRGQKPTQLSHIASPLNPTPNPSPSSKPQKIRQLVKKPHAHGPGYSFEITNANNKK
ncbi:uncharacterized protein LOC132201363 [Neocloeon triangulifer]|uniref:uncharacterized protein LOC132201363 n=1 Tax=Neocloeon triangulifer TaxID=2078957 RepID=UPI00286F701C|nr:uncharacterized protein LOC132201363 [Neocloeon triangulifer]